jgi:predicted house-cleaning noncanonical NTP pyrophosphatase (MazG superfamily)
MRPEDRLVYSLAKVDIDANTNQEIKKILSPGLNWAYFFEQANNQGVAALVYKSLSGIDYARALVPETILARLASCYYSVACRNTLLTEKLSAILDYFQKARIEIILLKGMALIQTIYPNIALRPIYDIDILIHPQDFAFAKAGLEALGYLNSAFYREDFYQDNIMVDVHEELINITRIKSRRKAHRIDMDEFWKNSLAIEINGQGARILSPEHTLMELCLHLTLHHGLQGLVWFVDIARLVEYYKNEIDWNKFIKETSDYRINRPVYYALFYVNKILRQDIPEYVLNQLKPERQNLLERKIFNLILSGRILENIRFFFTLTTMENLWDKLSFFRDITFPSTKTLSAKYNISSRASLPFCYIIHFNSILSSILKLLQIK